MVKNIKPIIRSLNYQPQLKPLTMKNLTTNLKQMVKTTTLVLASSILFSSCASFLNGRYQRVEIKTDKGATVMVDSEKAKMKRGKYLLKRDGYPKTISIEKEGYQTQHETILPYKKSKLRYLNAALIPLNPYAAAGVTLLDNSSRVWNYNKSYNFPYIEVLDLAEKTNDLKEVLITDVIFNVDSSDNNVVYYKSYKDYINSNAYINEGIGEFTWDGTNKEGDKVIALSTNYTLLEKGFIDTSDAVFKDSYSNNYYLGVEVNNVNLIIVNNSKGSKTGGMFNLETNAKWTLYNFYGDSIHSLKIESSTGDIGYYVDRVHPNQLIVEGSFLSLKKGMKTFLNDVEVTAFLNKANDYKLEDNYDELLLADMMPNANNVTEAINSSITVKTKSGHGSGFVISSNGYIVTNYHVIRDTSDLSIVFNNGDTYAATLLRTNKKHDLALLKIEKNDLTALSISKSTNFNLASKVYAIGTPTATDLSNTVSSGIISSVRVTEDGKKLIQTDASINSGNSGGPIVNEEGVVIGVVSSKLNGIGLEGLAFGIPAYEIFEALNISLDSSHTAYYKNAQ